MIAESETVLARWNLTFQQSLDTEMKRHPRLGNAPPSSSKSPTKKPTPNCASRRAQSLLAALGDLSHAPELLFLVERGEDDLDAVIARRVLLFASGIDPQRSPLA